MNLRVLCILLTAWSTPGLGATTLYTGTFTRDDDYARIYFEVLPGETAFVTTTVGYAGYDDGMFSVPSGGFDPVITVYGTYGLIVYRWDHPPPGCLGVGVDPATQTCLDKTGVATDWWFDDPIRDHPGTYMVEITQWDNGRPIHQGRDLGRTEEDFTAIFGCDAGRFCDRNGASRNGNWALLITTVPGPASGLLLLTGLLPLVGRLAATRKKNPPG